MYSLCSEQYQITHSCPEQGYNEQKSNRACTAMCSTVYTVVACSTVTDQISLVEKVEQLMILAGDLFDKMLKYYFLSSSHAEILDAIARDKDVSEETNASLTQAIQEFKQSVPY